MEMDHPVESVCPACSHALTSVGDARPWCPACEWGIDQYLPEESPRDTGWLWLDKRANRLAHRLTRTQYEALRGRAIDANPSKRVTMVITLLAGLLHVFFLAMLGLGGWLVVSDFPTPLLVPGVVILLVAVVLRPRVSRMPASAEPITRQQAPALYVLVDRIAAAVGAPSPDQIIVDSEFNAFVTTVGLRRRKVLGIGLPLLCVLPAAQRVALLGHEMGHLANRDPRRGTVTQPVFTTIGRLADLLRPTRTRYGANTMITMLAEMAAGLVLAAAHRLLAAVQFALWTIGFREQQQDEYLADDLSARAAGTIAAADLCDTLLLRESIEVVIRSSARANSATRRRDETDQVPIAAKWQEQARRTAAELSPTLPARRQLSVRRETSLFAAHPPAGLRSQLLRSRAHHDALVGLDEAASAQIDLELAPWYQRLRRDLAADAA